MIGARQLTLVLVLALASFGALFAAGRADRDSEPQAAPPHTVALPAASVGVAGLEETASLPSIRRRKVHHRHKKAAPAPEAAPVKETTTPEVDPAQVAPKPTYTRPAPAPAPAPAPKPAPSKPSDPGQSFDDSG